jgi:hypothetical protein
MFNATTKGNQMTKEDLKDIAEFVFMAGLPSAGLILLVVSIWAGW